MFTDSIDWAACGCPSSAGTSCHHAASLTSHTDWAGQMANKQSPMRWSVAVILWLMNMNGLSTFLLAVTWTMEIFNDGMTICLYVKSSWTHILTTFDYKSLLFCFVFSLTKACTVSSLYISQVLTKAILSRKTTAQTCMDSVSAIWGDERIRQFISSISDNCLTWQDNIHYTPHVAWLSSALQWITLQHELDCFICMAQKLICNRNMFY